MALRIMVSALGVWLALAAADSPKIKTIHDAAHAGDAKSVAAFLDKDPALIEAKDEDGNREFLHEFLLGTDSREYALLGEFASRLLTERLSRPFVPQRPQ